MCRGRVEVATQLLAGQDVGPQTNKVVAFQAIKSFMLGNNHASSLISAAEQGLRDTTFTANFKNWKIEDYVSKHMEFHSTLNDQQEQGTYIDMYEEQKVEKFLDGLKHSHFIGLKSNILCNPKMHSDFNATAADIKDMVNRTPTLKNPPGRQVAAMGRGGGRGRGTDRGGRDAAAEVVGADMTVAADTGAKAITISEIVIAPQAHTPSGP